MYTPTLFYVVKQIIHGCCEAIMTQSLLSPILSSNLAITNEIITEQVLLNGGLLVKKTCIT